MLVEQTAINFAANAFSAAFGLLNVVVFTRLFAPAEFGTYVLGAGFAATVATAMTAWLRLPILREQARGDGTDVRGIVLPGFALSCLIAPAAFVAARLVALDGTAALAALGLALAVGFFETTQELLRARLQAFTVMKATIIRALLVPVLGVAFAMVGPKGIFLLVSSALAYLLAAVVFTRHAWSGTVLQTNLAPLLKLAKDGLPLTASLTLLAMSSVIDRFIIAHAAGPAYAGTYTAGVDLVRQTLIIPAVSASAAFFPLAVQILANRGKEAVRVHLDECFQFLLAITLPACVGLALVASHIANVVLGAEFRSMAAQVMPVVSIAVIFQILTYQYLHISFLLSGRNALYLVNTGSVLAFNAIVSYFLVVHFGAVGAAGGRLAAELFGFVSALLLTRYAFPVPLPLRRVAPVLAATIIMAVTVKALDAVLVIPDSRALVVLISGGVASYLATCWLLDVAKARHRLNHCRLAVRNIFAQ